MNQLKGRESMKWSKKIPDWIFINAEFQPPTVECQRCGEKREVHIPCTITDFIKQSEGFGDSHRLCAPPSKKEEER